jgi:hypothetical protein
MSTADPAATILLVEDDGPTRTFLADNLTATATTCWWPTARATACGCWRRSSPTWPSSTSACPTGGVALRSGESVNGIDDDDADCAGSDRFP